MKLRTMLCFVGLSVLSSSCYMDSLYYESAWEAPHHYATPRVSASYRTYSPPVYLNAPVSRWQRDRDYGYDRVESCSPRRDWYRESSRYCPTVELPRYRGHCPSNRDRRSSSYSFSYSSY